MVEESSEVLPLKPEEKMLNGHIWLLVGRKVFSSSEYSAFFSKATGFATLVGERTGGNGLGSDPLAFILPNSGLAIRYSMELDLTPDGANNQEYGTMPDFISPENETALDTCLRLIESADEYNPN